ncbi:MAG: hypothetical protein HY738_06650 [Bacteroidia bacterium]|nr:hypothetical protein [Bacteroidia bacterium]
MIKSSIRIFIIGLIATITTYTFSQNADTIPYKNNLEKYYFYALQGNVASIINKLDSLSDNSLNKAEIELKQKYIKRFKNQDEAFDYRTKDTFLINISKLYHTYWNEALMQKYHIPVAESILRENLEKYLCICFSGKINKRKIHKDVFRYTKESIYDLIGFFITNTGQARSNSHSFANYHVIKNLSKELFQQDMVEEINDWKKFSYEEINTGAKKLLLINSENLKRAGKKVFELIKPKK